jgi:hypothetical protein
LSDTILDIIPKVSNKSHSILQLNVQSLIVNGRPLALDRFRLAFTLIAALTQDGLSLIALDQVDSISVTGSKLVLVVFAHHLDLVWHPMSTQLLAIEEIDITFVRTDVEIPNSVEFLANAMHRLVGGDEMIRRVAERIGITN